MFPFPFTGFPPNSGKAPSSSSSQKPRYSPYNNNNNNNYNNHHRSPRHNNLSPDNQKVMDYISKKMDTELKEDATKEAIKLITTVMTASGFTSPTATPAAAVLPASPAATPPSAELVALQAIVTQQSQTLATLMSSLQNQPPVQPRQLHFGPVAAAHVPPLQPVAPPLHPPGHHMQLAAAPPAAAAADAAVAVAAALPPLQPLQPPAAAVAVAAAPAHLLTPFHDLGLIHDTLTTIKQRQYARVIKDTIKLHKNSNAQQLSNALAAHNIQPPPIIDLDTAVPLISVVTFQALQKARKV